MHKEVSEAKMKLGKLENEIALQASDREKFIRDSVTDKSEIMKLKNMIEI